MQLLVTVGTTLFDELIDAILNNSFLCLAKELKYTKIIVQIGNGKFPIYTSFDGIDIEIFRFKPALDSLMIESDLLISHAGAGCILEGLRNKKRLLVVINERLMGNHQLELAKSLFNMKHLSYCYPSSLLSSFEEAHSIEFVSFPPAEKGVFGKFLSSVSGKKLMAEN